MSHAHAPELQMRPPCAALGRRRPAHCAAARPSERLDAPTFWRAMPPSTEIQVPPRTRRHHVRPIRSAIEPQVNLQATTHVRNYDLDVHRDWQPDRLNITIVPSRRAKSDIIALLALGRTSQDRSNCSSSRPGSVYRRSHNLIIARQSIRREQPYAEVLRQPDQD